MHTHWDPGGDSRRYEIMNKLTFVELAVKTFQKRSLRPLVTGSAPKRTGTVQALRSSNPKMRFFPFLLGARPSPRIQY